ncbi:MAG: Asp-tRNA(Asn)/Glu-tRNA(Gln) amidotransferase subunit GatA [Candidatus Roizmanbacteria bacterium]
MFGKSLYEIKEQLEKKEVSVKEVFQYFIKRIQKYNPSLNAYLTILDDEKQKDVNMSGPLAGVPLAIKDNFCTKGVRTTASAKVLDAFIPPYESTVTRRLKEAGALMLGKTNMDAWAHGSSTETSDYGPTKNPWDITRAPGGSSGGSASAISAYLAPGTIGSETAGSIRQPSSWCGTIGLKPTYGRVSRYGVVAMGSSLDSPGPIVSTVRDSALLLQLIAGKDPYDATSSSEPVDDYVSYIKKPKKYTIGITDAYFEGVDDEVKQKVFDMIEILKKLGHTVKKIDMIHPKYAISVYTIIQRAEVSSNLARYDGIRYGEDRTVFGNEAKKRIMLGTYTLSHGYYDAYYKKALRVRELMNEDFKRVFSEVDFIVAPTTPITALTIGESAKYPFFGEVMDVLLEASSICGIPAINIPAGLDSKHLPIGVQIMGNYFDEKNILNIAQQIEDETKFFGILQKGFEKYRD